MDIKQKIEDDAGIDLSKPASGKELRQVASSDTYSATVRFMMKCSGGLIKTEKQARFILFVFSVLLIIISFFFFFDGSEKQELFAPPATLE